jgi:hypothetical protein
MAIESLLQSKIGELQTIAIEIKAFIPTINFDEPIYIVFIEFHLLFLAIILLKPTLRVLLFFGLFIIFKSLDQINDYLIGKYPTISGTKIFEGRACMNLFVRVPIFLEMILISVLLLRGKLEKQAKIEAASDQPEIKLKTE